MAIQYIAEYDTALILRLRNGEIAIRYLAEGSRTGIPPDYIILAEFPASYLLGGVIF